MCAPLFLVYFSSFYSKKLHKIVFYRQEKQNTCQWGSSTRDDILILCLHTQIQSGRKNVIVEALQQVAAGNKAGVALKQPLLLGAQLQN